MDGLILTDVPTWNSESLTKSTLNQGLKDRCGTISLPSGELTVTQLEGILRTLPFELTFVDAADTNRFFGIHTAFSSALDRPRAFCL